jgi:RNA polymerase sigma-70 factor (ECF subfamily)
VNGTAQTSPAESSIGAPSDEVLVARVRQRDSAALTMLYDRYATQVYALAGHALGSADAEEVVQDVFLRLWHKAGQFDPALSSFGAWFMAIARHRVLDELRRRGHQSHLRAAGSVEQALSRTIDPGPGIEEEFWRRESGIAVLHALQRLPEEQRRVLVLGYFGGLSHAEMSAHLGWPLGTVKKRVRLGMRKLRAALDGMAPSSDEGAGGAGRMPLSRSMTAAPGGVGA